MLLEPVPISLLRKLKVERQLNRLQNQVDDIEFSYPVPLSLSRNSSPIVKDLKDPKKPEQIMKLLTSDKPEEQLEAAENIVSSLILDGIKCINLTGLAGKTTLFRDMGILEPLVLSLKKKRSQEYLLEAVRALFVLSEFNGKHLKALINS